MKKTKLSLILSGLIIVGAVMVSSCKKKESTTPTQNNDTSSSTDNNTSETASKDIMNIGSQAIDNGHLTTYRLVGGGNGGGMISPMSGTVTVNLDSLSAKKVTVTFSSNFVGSDGIQRSGTLFYDWSSSSNGANYFKDAGFSVAVTTPLNDYKVNGNLVTINKKHVRNLGPVSGNYTWSDTANITITKANNGGTITWNRTGNMVLLNTNAITYNGSSVPGVYPTSAGSFINWPQAVIGFTGNASGTTASGSSYTANITSRIEYNFNCSPSTQYPYFHPPVAGSLDFTPQGVTTRTINYGTGACDAIFTITVGVWSVTLNFV